MAVAEQICAAALAFGGTITGEHGMGELKRQWLSDQLDATSLSVQAAIKQALDPCLLMDRRGY